jgi:arylsulfatase A-like enzyme
MPVLRELAERGATFDWAFAPSNVTRRSLPSIVIGLAPNRVRGRVVGWGLRVDPRHVLLAERLRAGGYATAGFMSLPNFFNDEGRTGLQRGIEYLAIEPNGHKLAGLAATWLTARKDKRPLFLWMHILEPHNWTAGVGVPRSDQERKTYYDRALAASDTMLKRIVDVVGDRAILIVTADHGEALGEHGHDYHSTDLYDSQMRVPLVMAGPGIRAHRVPEIVSLVDLVPTIVELAGFEPPADMLDGHSIADLATGTRAGVGGTGTAFAAMIKDRSNPGGVNAFVDGPWKIIDTEGRLELYDISKDPDEHVDLAAEQPAVLARLFVELLAHERAGSPFR